MKNRNCSLNESQSWLLTWVTDLTFCLWQSWCCSGTLCWLSCCHVATLLTHCKGKICSHLGSGQCCWLWWCWARRLWEDFCSEMFDFQTVWMDLSVLTPEWLLLQVQQLENVPWEVLAWDLWEKNKSNSSYLPATVVLCFGTQGTNSVPEYLTLLVKYTTFLDYS